MKPAVTAVQQPVPFLRILGAFVVVYLFWGSTYLAIRVGVETFPPFLLAGIRFCIAGPVLLAVTSAWGAAWPTRREWRAAAITGGLLLAGGNGMVVLAERDVPSSITALIIATTPVWFALGDWLRPGGQRPAHRTWVGIVLGIAGVAFLTHARSGGSSPLTVPVLGLELLLVATISWSTGSLLVKHLAKPPSPLMMSGAQMTCGGILLLLMAIPHGEWNRFSIPAISDRSWMALAYLIVFGSWAGFSAYVWLLKVTTPARVSTYAYVNPIIAVLLGWLILDEPITTQTLLAAAVLLTGVAIVVWPARTPASRSLSKAA